MKNCISTYQEIQNNVIDPGDKIIDYYHDALHNNNYDRELLEIIFSNKNIDKELLIILSDKILDKLFELENMEDVMDVLTIPGFAENVDDSCCKFIQYTIFKYIKSCNNLEKIELLVKYYIPESFFTDTIKDKFFTEIINSFLEESRDMHNLLKLDVIKKQFSSDQIAYLMVVCLRNNNFDIVKTLATHHQSTADILKNSIVIYLQKMSEQENINLKQDEINLIVNLCVEKEIDYIQAEILKEECEHYGINNQCLNQYIIKFDKEKKLYKHSIHKLGIFTPAEAFDYSSNISEKVNLPIPNFIVIPRAKIDSITEVGYGFSNRRSLIMLNKILTEYINHNDNLKNIYIYKSIQNMFLSSEDKYYFNDKGNQDVTTSKPLFEQYQQNQPILINSGYVEHDVTIIFDHGYMIVGNRGVGIYEHGPCSIYKLSHDLIEKDLKILLKANDTDDITSCHNILANLAGGIPNEKFILNISMNPQKYGTCSYTSKKAAICGYIALTKLRESTLSDSEDLQKKWEEIKLDGKEESFRKEVKNIYKDFTGFDKDSQISVLIDTSNANTATTRLALSLLISYIIYHGDDYKSIVKYQNIISRLNDKALTIMFELLEIKNTDSNEKKDKIINQIFNLIATIPSVKMATSLGIQHATPLLRAIIRKDFKAINTILEKVSQNIIDSENINILVTEMLNIIANSRGTGNLSDKEMFSFCKLIYNNKNFYLNEEQKQRFKILSNYPILMNLIKSENRKEIKNMLTYICDLYQDLEASIVYQIMNKAKEIGNDFFEILLDDSIINKLKNPFLDTIISYNPSLDILNKVLGFLEKKGKDKINIEINEINKTTQDNLLHTLVGTNDKEIIEFLLNKYPDLLNKINDENNFGITPFSKCIQQCDIYIIKFLIDECNKGDININCSNILHDALTKPADIDLTSLILEKFPDSIKQINKTNNNGETPFFVAIRWGDINLINLLVNQATLSTHKIEINFDSIDKEKNNILHCLCSNMNNESRKQILTQFPEWIEKISMLNSQGCLPIFNLTHDGDKDVLFFLLEKAVDKNISVDLNLQSDSGDTLLSQAIINSNILHKNEYIIDFLLEKSSIENIKNTFEIIKEKAWINQDSKSKLQEKLNELELLTNSKQDVAQSVGPLLFSGSQQNSSSMILHSNNCLDKIYLKPEFM